MGKNRDFDDDYEKTAVLGLQDLGLRKIDFEARSAYLIMINGRTVGRMHKLSAGTSTLGRSPDVEVLIEDEGVSRHHARIEITGEGYVLADNNSTNGIFVNGEKVTRQLLQDGDKVQIGSNTILKFSFQDEVEEKFQKQLYDSATRDGLTGTFNKKYFADQLKTEFAFCFRHRQPLSLLLFDIDFFKRLNDTYGHLAGDACLKNLAKVVAKALRTEDVFARYGGEEFGVILRDTDAERAFLIAERVRRSIEQFEFMWEKDRMPVTISVGISTLANQEYASPKALVKAADEFLYKAKHGGRNRTESQLM
jgi:two-component system, cell cycle response regulator